MGDFTKNGTKIGTCGKAYYATYWQIQNQQNLGGDLKYYLNLKRENGFSYAFPFPEFDGKKLGQISQFHIKASPNEIGKVIYPIYLEDIDCKEINHDEVFAHICDTYTSEKQIVRVPCKNSKNKYYMEYTGFIHGVPSILLYCAYCGSGTHYTLNKDGTNEITKAINRAILNNNKIIKTSKNINQEKLKKENEYHKEILTRVFDWYNIPSSNDFIKKESKSLTRNNDYKNYYL